MELERVFILAGLAPDGGVGIGWAALCESCFMQDSAAVERNYRHILELSAGLQECGVGDGCTVIAHYDGVEVRHQPDADLRRLTRLPWRTRVDYRLAREHGYMWHR